MLSSLRSLHAETTAYVPHVWSRRGQAEEAREKERVVRQLQLNSLLSKLRAKGSKATCGRTIDDACVMVTAGRVMAA